MPAPPKFLHARRKGWRFFWRSEPAGQKILPEPCMEKSPYIESESKLAIKLLKKIIISRVYDRFHSCQIKQL